ncbi:hypothetical protein [Streptomyces pinistramenti]|uniref:hypothetical protein n=1 Tax=Streptomyces pinistramenti TaxID=2884812 RepID=UPI001D0887EA|nr:hypothetical protein [Streptomyces pinistramenti]MCB5911714.1 hypothetical protein [Streptomyces pinistramenti]
MPPPGSAQRPLSLRRTQQTEFETIGRDYWATGEREEAEEKATAFVNAFRRLGIDFDGIGIKEPCGGCRRREHKVAIGSISVAEAGDFAGKLNQALDLLGGYRAQQPCPD